MEEFACILLLPSIFYNIKAVSYCCCHLTVMTVGSSSKASEAMIWSSQLGIDRLTGFNVGYIRHVFMSPLHAPGIAMAIWVMPYSVWAHGAN